MIVRRHRRHRRAFAFALTLAFAFPLAFVLALAFPLRAENRVDLHRHRTRGSGRRTCCESPRSRVGDDVVPQSLVDLHLTRMELNPLL